MLQDTPSPHLDADRAAVHSFLGDHAWCRILWVVVGFDDQIGLDVALHERYVQSLDAPNVVCASLRRIEDIDAYLEKLSGDGLPTLAVLFYNKPVKMDIPADDRHSELFRRRDRAIKLERIFAFCTANGVSIFMECGDMQSRLGNDHFYDEIRRHSVVGLITHNRGAIEPLQEELAERGLLNVHTVIWQPLGMDSEFHRDYGLPKVHNVLMYGRTDERFRTQLYRYCQWKQWSTLGRFGFHKLERNRAPGLSSFVPHEALYRDINQALSVVVAHQTRDSYRGRPIAMTYSKYFEVAACRTVVLGQPTQDLPALGFVDGEHYIAVRPDNYKSVLGRIHRDVRSPHFQQMAAQGHALVHERHRISQHINATLRSLVDAMATRRTAVLLSAI